MPDLFDEIAADIGKEFEAVGPLIVSDVKTLISINVEYGPGGAVIVRSKPGEPPRRETGLLQSSIGYGVQSGEIVSLQIDSDCPYSGFLEKGTTHMAQRPYFETVADFWANELPDRLVNVIQNP